MSVCVPLVRHVTLAGMVAVSCPPIYSLAVCSSWDPCHIDFLNTPWKFFGGRPKIITRSGVLLAWHFPFTSLLPGHLLFPPKIADGSKFSLSKDTFIFLCLDCYLFVTQAVSTEPFIVWQRFCEPARLGIAYCLSVCLCSACLTCNIARDVTTAWVSSIDIGYWFTPLPDKLSAEDRSLYMETWGFFYDDSTNPWFHESMNP